MPRYVAAYMPNGVYTSDGHVHVPDVVRSVVTGDVPRYMHVIEHVTNTRDDVMKGVMYVPMTARNDVGLSVPAGRWWYLRNDRDVRIQLIEALLHGWKWSPRRSGVPQTRIGEKLLLPQSSKPFVSPLVIP